MSHLLVMYQKASTTKSFPSKWTLWAEAVAVATVTGTQNGQGRVGFTYHTTKSVHSVGELKGMWFGSTGW